MQKRVLFSLIFIVLAVVPLGCNIGNLKLTARFNTVSGLVAGDRVINEQGYIGNVENITRSDTGRYLVELDIDRAHKKKITDYSIFYINADPDTPGHQAIFTEQAEAGGIPLVNGSVVAGLDSPPYLRHLVDDLMRKAKELSGNVAGQLSDQLKDSENEIATKMKELEQALRTAPESPEAKELSKNLDTLVSNLETAVERVRIVIGEDLVNAFHDSLNGFRKRLDELHKRRRSTPEKSNGSHENVRI